MTRKIPVFLLPCSAFHKTRRNRTIPFTRVALPWQRILPKGVGCSGVRCRNSKAPSWLCPFNVCCGVLLEGLIFVAGGVRRWQRNPFWYRGLFPGKNEFPVKEMATLAIIYLECGPAGDGAGQSSDAPQKASRSPAAWRSSRRSSSRQAAPRPRPAEF